MEERELKNKRTGPPPCGCPTEGTDLNWGRKGSELDKRRMFGFNTQSKKDLSNTLKRTDSSRACLRSYQDVETSGAKPAQPCPAFPQSHSSVN